MKQAIEKALSGGWDKKRALFNPNDASYSIEKMLLDPLFWQALCKALGWEESKSVYDYGDGGLRIVPGWLYYWTCFIHHLAEGKDADSFFNSLLK